MKKVFLWFMVVAIAITMVAAFSLVGCKTTTTVEETTAAATTVKFKIGFSNASVSNTWRVAMYETIKEVVAQHPEVEFFYTDANDNADKQVSDVDDLLSKGIDLLMISPATTEALNGAVEKVFDKGIPVVTFDRYVTTEKFTTFVTTSDEGCGQYSAERVVALLTEKFGEPKGNVVIIQGYMGSGPQIDRQKGMEGVFSKYPNIKIVSQQPADFAKAKAIPVMENAMAANPQIDALTSHSDESMLGAIEAIDAAGRKDITILVGLGGQNGFLKLIKEGRADSTILFPCHVGAEAFMTSLKILNGEKVPKLISLPLIPVNKDNVDTYYKPSGGETDWAW